MEVDREYETIICEHNLVQEIRDGQQAEVGEEMSNRRDEWQLDKEDETRDKQQLDEHQQDRTTYKQQQNEVEEWDDET